MPTLTPTGDRRMDGEVNTEERQRIICIVLGALRTDGAHHKQWYLEKILEELDADDFSDRDWEEGVAP